MDHQYSWPMWIWEKLGLDDLTWRQAVREIASGKNGIPPLDIPKRYCARINAWMGEDIFWTPLKGRAKDYGKNQLPHPFATGQQVTSLASKTKLCCADKGWSVF